MLNYVVSEGEFMLPATLTDELKKLSDLRLSKAISQKDFDKFRNELYRTHGLKPPKPAKRPGGVLVFVVIALSILIGTILGSAPIGQQLGGSGGLILLTMLVLFLYLLPAFIAYERSHRQRHAILILNVVFGWSFVGWIIALIWSAMSARDN